MTDPQVSDADQITLADDNAGFALDAYHKIAAEKANLVFSPASVSIALSMAYAGAAGTTAAEMASALHFTLPTERLFPAFNSLDLNLASRGEGKKSSDGGPMQVRIVNAAWAERRYQFRSEFLDTLASNFGAGIDLLDFAKTTGVGTHHHQRLGGRADQQPHQGFAAASIGGHADPPGADQRRVPERCLESAFRHQLHPGQHFQSS